MEVCFEVNQRACTVVVPAGTTLLSVLRDELGLIGARLRRVLEAVRVRSGWGQTAPRPGHGLGVACASYRGTYVAEVADVFVAPNGTVRLERVFCAVDPGRVVDPDGARNQAEGAIQHAASWTLLEELPHANGEVLAATWDDYPIASFRDAPQLIEVELLGDDATPSTGMREPACVPTAAAIANAVFAACGARIRRLPIRPAVVRAERG